MGSYTFEWEHPAEEVYVTGTFDDWTKSVKLEKEGDVFKKTVELKDASTKIYYKFVVDNNWVINESAPKEPDHEGNVNNFLTPEDIKSSSVAAAVINTVAPTSTTAAMAGEQPIETKPVEEPKETPSDIPGGFPVTPANELDKPIGVNPLPAAEGAVNPITLAPGEKVPESVAAESTTSHVKLDKESYEKSDALPGVETEMPPVTKSTIPESSLPIAGATDVTIATVAPTATTAILAGQVPLEPKAEIPEVVKESQDKAAVPPEASAETEKVTEKAQVEEELKEKVPEAAPTSEGTSGGEGTVAGLAAIAATAGGAVIAAGIAAKEVIEEKAAPYVSDAAETVNEKLPESVKEKLPVAVQDALDTQTKESKIEEVSPEVPAEVKESIVESGKAPEAAANTEAVEEKKVVEAELLKEVKPVPAETEAKTEETVPEPVVPAVVPPVVTAETEAPKAEETAPAVEPVAPVETEAAKTEAPKTETPAAVPENGSKATETKPAAAAANGSAQHKKKHNRLSSIFSKIKHKLSDK